MDKNLDFYLTAILALLIVVVGGFVAMNLQFSDYKYATSRPGADFVSNVDEPPVLLDSIRGSTHFIVSPQFVQNGAQNSYMASSLTLFNTVLSAKRKNIVVIGRVVDEKGAILECQSNFGDFKTNEAISKELCEQMLADATSVRAFVDLPSSSLSSNRIILEKNLVRVEPSSFDGVAVASYTLLEALYPDTPAIIESVNNLVNSAK